MLKGLAILIRCSLTSSGIITKDPGGVVGSTSRGWRWVGLGECKVGGVESRSDHTPWILCSVVRTISHYRRTFRVVKLANGGFKRY